MQVVGHGPHAEGAQQRDSVPRGARAAEGTEDSSPEDRHDGKTGTVFSHLRGAQLSDGKSGGPVRCCVPVRNDKLPALHTEVAAFTGPRRHVGWL